MKQPKRYSVRLTAQEITLLLIALRIADDDGSLNSDVDGDAEAEARRRQDVTRITDALRASLP